MSTAERILGKLEEFKDAAEKRLTNIEDKIDELQAFRWRMLGAASMFGAIGGVLIQIFIGGPHK